jgi:hypothetical protein
LKEELLLVIELHVEDFYRKTKWVDVYYKHVIHDKLAKPTDDFFASKRKALQILQFFQWIREIQPLEYDEDCQDKFCSLSSFFKNSNNFQVICKVFFM